MSKSSPYFSRRVGVQSVCDRGGDLASECLHGGVSLVLIDGFSLYCMGSAVHIRLLMKTQFVFPELWFCKTVSTKNFFSISFL